MQMRWHAVEIDSRKGSKAAMIPVQESASARYR